MSHSSLRVNRFPARHHTTARIPARLGCNAGMPIREEADLRQRYGQRYRGELLDAATVAEREALGSDYGGNGYTSRAQADQLLELLALGECDRLLDLGAGCGWPGLYLADRSGCQVVLSDLTVAGMRRGLDRAEADGMAERTAAVVASARHLPFRPENFDAIVHADLLC
jgi:SAM-dependent methyltransferase